MREYREKASNWVDAYRVRPEDRDHIVDIVASLMMTRDGVLSGGSFVHAVLENDLFNTVGRGDEVCQRNLKVIVAAKYYCHL